MKILLNSYNGITKSSEVLMVMEFHKLNSKRTDFKGTGIAVIIKDQYEDEDEPFYNLISIDDRNVWGSTSELYDNAKYIYDTLPQYPKGVALTFQFTKYREIELTDDIKLLINAYNIIKEMDVKEGQDFQIWESMNKGEFKKWKKENNGK